MTTGLAYLFFVHLRGWTPPPNEQVLYVHLFDIFVSIILAIQMVTVAFTSTSGGRIEIGADLITTFFPAIFMLIVVIRNWTGDAPLSVDQVWDAWFAFGMMWLDVVVDIGVILLAQTRIAISGGRNP